MSGVLSKLEAKKLVVQIENGEELTLEDARMVRYVSRMMGRKLRKRTFVGRDTKRRLTLLKLL